MVDLINYMKVVDIVNHNLTCSYGQYSCGSMVVSSRMEQGGPNMKSIMTLAIAAQLTFGLVIMPEHTSAQPRLVDQRVEHGGGCRKSSPPGQCCHMDRKAGTVHCH